MKLLALVTLVMAAFAANSVLNRAALEWTDTGPVSFMAMRLMSGAVLLGSLVALSGGMRHLRPTRQIWPGVLTLAIYMVGFSLAYLSLAAGTGALILFGAVQITMFAAAFLNREPLPPARILGAMIAFSGLVWLMAPGATQPDPWGAALMVLAGVGWGLFSLIGRKSAAPLGTMAASFLWCAPLGLLVWLTVADGLDGTGAVLAIICGTLTSGLGYALWYHVLPQMPASRAAVAQLTVPLIAALGGMITLAEPLSFRFALSSVLVLGGVLLALRTR